jgi:hypothetical protein
VSFGLTGVVLFFSGLSLKESDDSPPMPELLRRTSPCFGVLLLIFL